MTNKNDTTELRGNLAGSADFFHYADNLGKTDVISKRFGKKILSEGTSGGKLVKKESFIDDSPWFPSFEHAAQKLLGTGKEEIEFWMINPGTFDAMKMVVKKKEREKIEIEGKSYETIKIEATLAGLLGALWKSDYWFTFSKPHEFVRFKGLMGPPGSQEVLMELLDRKTI